MSDWDRGNRDVKKKLGWEDLGKKITGTMTNTLLTRGKGKQLKTKLTRGEVMKDPVGKTAARHRWSTLSKALDIQGKLPLLGPTEGWVNVSGDPSRTKKNSFFRTSPFSQNTSDGIGLAGFGKVYVKFGAGKVFGSSEKQFWGDGDSGTSF